MSFSISESKKNEKKTKKTLDIGEWINGFIVIFYTGDEKEMQ